MLSIALLGPLEVHRDGRPVNVPAGKSAELLVRLALDAGTAVRADRLVDDVWADDAVRTQRNTLQSKVARLRRALGDTAIATMGDGYALDIDRAQVDALAVIDLAATVAALRSSGDDTAALALARSSLELYRGEALVGVGAWADPHRARLDEARLALVEVRAAARVDLGEWSEAIGELEEALVAHPYQEQLWVQLVTALYRSGRQADALAALGRVRAVLADELGLDPGRQLRDLEHRILVHDPSLAGSSGASSLTAMVPSAASAVGNLPSMTVELVGRATDVAGVRSLLDRHRLVEIVGTGGIGKTALAVAVGAAVAPATHGGVWMVRLEVASTADDVLDAMIAALRVTGGEAALFERLRTADALVVLDNCEHVVDAVAQLVGRMLDDAPSVRLLCTSQIPLDMAGEHVYELAPLDLVDAVELFTRRATAQRRNRQLDDAGGSVEQLCRSLDGLPLAIELAAARTRTLSVGEITRRLDDRFQVLHDPTSRQPERRRALKATIRWSYEMLFPDDQRGLWALATFAGGAALDAVEHVLGALDVPAPAAIDVVDRLVSRSLVIVDDQSSPALPRYRLLDSIRAYALDALADAGSTDIALGAHARWFADVASGSTAGVRSQRQAEHLAVARVERANIDAALAWCATHDPPLGLAIAIGFGWAWVVLGDSRGAQRILAALEAAGATTPAADQGAALLLAGWLEASTGDLDPARAHIAAASRLADQIGDVELQASCRHHLAYVVSHHGHFDEAIELAAESRRLLGTRDRPWEHAASWLLSARAFISAGDRAAAGPACAEVQRWLSLVDDPWLHARSAGMLGEYARIDRRFDDAVEHFERAVATSHRLGFQQTEAYQVSCLGRALCQAGRADEGLVTLQSAVELAEAIGDVRMAALARVHLGRVLRGTGLPARSVIESTVAWHRAAGGGEQAPLGECLLAAIDAADGHAGAAERLDALLVAARAANEAHVEVFALDALALLAARDGRLDEARSLCDAADASMQHASHFITELDRVDARAARLVLTGP